MKIVVENGLRLVTQYMYPDDQITPGSIWAPANGGYTVEVTSFDPTSRRVFYKGDDGLRHRSKLALAFQSRYFRVLAEGEEPPILTNKVRTYKVKIQATIVKTVEVEATNEAEAIELAHQQFTVAVDGLEEDYNEETLDVRES